MKRPIKKTNHTLPKYGLGGWLKNNWSAAIPGMGLPMLLAGVATGKSTNEIAEKVAPIAAPIIGGAVGTAIGGPMGGAMGSQLGSGITGTIQQEQAMRQQNSMIKGQENINRLNQLNQQFAANNNFQSNIPTFCKGGRTMKKIKKYPGGGVNNVFGNPLANLQTPNGVVVDRGDIPLIDTSIEDSMSTRREELVNYGSLNNPQLYSDIRNSDSPESKTASYLSALKTGTGNEGSTPYTRTLLDNVNKYLGVDRGFFYNPEGAGMAHITETTNPVLYKQLKAKYTIPNTNNISGKRLQSSGSMGIGTKQYAKGGYIADSNITANSELEDEEVFRTPQGGMFQLNGATHAEGGIPMNLPQGTEILGKNKIPGTNKSFKEYGAKLMRDYNKYTKILDSKPTGLARKTAERMIDNINNDYTNTMNLQESMKPISNGNNKYPDGGTYFKNNPKLLRDFQSMYGLTPDNIYGNKTKAAWDKYGDEYMNNQLSPITPMQGRVTANNVGSVGIKYNNPQGSLNPLISDMQRYGSNKVSTQPGSFNGEAVMGQIMDYAPIVYNLVQGIFNKPQKLKASDYYNPNENQATNLMANRRYNVNPELEANRNAQINYTRALRQGAPSQAQYLGNIQNSQIARSRSDAEAIARKQNMDNAYMGEEAQMRANLGQQRAATNLTIQDINDRNKSAARSYIPTALSQLQQANQVNRLMKNMKKTDSQKAKLLQGMFRGYGFNKYFNTEE